MNETLQNHFTRLYLSRLLSTPRGRAYLLNQVADAEDSDEGQVFDRLLARVKDETLRKAIRTHQLDEKRHAELFRECLERTGHKPTPVPAELKLLDRIATGLDGLLDKPIENDLDVMYAYLTLQVIEERAITQFKLFIEAFDNVDKATADVFRAVARDEERHLKYCHAIARRHAPDEKTHADALARFRDVEAKAFSDNSRTNLQYALANDVVQLGAVERAFWKTMGWLTEKTARPIHTPFRGLPPGARADAIMAEALAA